MDNNLTTLGKRENAVFFSDTFVFSFVLFF